VLGCWTQPDTVVPVGVQGVQAWDRYAYVNNSPVRFNDPSGHCIDGISTAICIGAAIGATISVASYITASRLTGKEITPGGVVGSLVAGAIGGAVSVIAAPLAAGFMSSVGIQVTAASVSVGSAVVNGTAGAIAYNVGGSLSNSVNRLEGIEPEYKFSATDTLTAGLLSGSLSYGFAKAFPVTSGQYSLAQANKFLPGRQMNTLFATPNAINQYGQVAWTSGLGATVAIHTSTQTPKKSISGSMPILITKNEMY
jgi:hypothetical protein